MNRSLARAVIATLRSSKDSASTQDLRQFGIRDWQQTLDWLDDSGLSLYLLRRLQDGNTTTAVSPQVLSHLELRLRNNRLRWEHLAQELTHISHRFQQTGIRFAVIKGISLIPDYCPDVLLRAPSDLDFLINREDLGYARNVLEEAGYRLKDSSGIEVKFWKPTRRMPTTSDCPYSLSTEPLIELHFGFWDDGNRIPLVRPLFSLDRLVSHSWHGLVFPVLNGTDAFLLQVIHVFQHITTFWVKLSWLLEIGFFMSNSALDRGFWLTVDDEMQRVPGLVEFAGIVVGLVKIVFGLTSPNIVNDWMNSLRPNARLWLENYAEIWLIDDHPFRHSSFFSPAKLALLLHQQYVSNPREQVELARRCLFPWKRPDNKVSFPIDYAPSRTLRSQWVRSMFALGRVGFHVGATLRYLYEIPRWNYRINQSPLTRYGK